MRNQLEFQEFFLLLDSKVKFSILNIMVKDSTKFDVIFLLLGAGSTFRGQK